MDNTASTAYIGAVLQTWRARTKRSGNRGSSYALAQDISGSTITGQGSAPLSLCYQLLEDSNRTGFPLLVLILQGRLCSFGLACCGKQENFCLATRFINRKLFWKSNRDARQEMKSQQSAKITCYFQMAYRHTPTKVGPRLPNNSKFSLPRKPKTTQSSWQSQSYEYLPHTSGEPTQSAKIGNNLSTLQYLKWEFTTTSPWKSMKV